MAEHSKCQPGRPAPHGVGHDGSPGFAAFHNDKAAVSKNADEIRGALEVLGCDPFDVAFASSGGSDLSAALDGTIKLALAERAAARERKDFAASDAIRDGLAAFHNAKSRTSFLYVSSASAAGCKSSKC